MEKNFKRTTVTAALPYANGPVHIGHLAGVYVPADIYVRYLRLKGRQVIFVGGSDEHGVPVTIRARKEGISVQQVVDRYHELIKESFSRFGISFDIYSRTTSDIHHKLASDFFRKLYDEGKFVEQVSEQFYDEQTGRFLTDRNSEWRKQLRTSMKAKERTAIERVKMPELDPEIEVRPSENQIDDLLDEILTRTHRNERVLND